MGKSKLEVTVHHCRDLPKVQKLGKQDPYIVLRYGSQEFRTKTSENGDKDPVFNEKFLFVVSNDSTVLDMTILNDNRRHDGIIGTAKIDFVLALEQGKIHKTIPVINDRGSPQGMIELTIKNPEVLEAQRAVHAVEAMKVSDAQESHAQALSDARSQFYPGIAAALAPHQMVSDRLSGEHLEGIKGLMKDEEEEIAGIFENPKSKVQSVFKDVAEEYAKLTSTFLKDFHANISEQVPSGAGEFQRQLSTLQQIVSESDARRASRLAQAQKQLLGGFEEVLSKYRGAMIALGEEYESSFIGAVVRYKGEVEGQLKSSAEAKAQAEANRVAPAPAAPPPPAPITIAASAAVSASSAAPSHAPSHHAPPAYQPAPQPAPVYYQPAPAPAPAPAPVYHQPAPAPAPVYHQPAPQGYYSAPGGAPVTQAEQATRDAQAAQQAAYRAQQEAEAAKRQAAQTQAQVQQQQAQMQQQAAVRRGVVGGVILSRALRR